MGWDMMLDVGFDAIVDVHACFCWSTTHCSSNRTQKLASIVKELAESCRCLGHPHPNSFLATMHWLFSPRWEGDPFCHR